MKLLLILVCCTTISLSASAQWWNVSLKKHERFPQLVLANNNAVTKLPSSTIIALKIPACNLAQSNNDYCLGVRESIIMKIAQHNMRFRVYDAASYNFSDLAQLYVLQNRLSEAKWYFLQSNNISRQENDDKHTISNLKALAMIKANIGEVIMAQQDLAEARAMAVAKTWKADIADIDKEVKFIQENRSVLSKTAIRYADAVVPTDKKTD